MIINIILFNAAIILLLWFLSFYKRLRLKRMLFASYNELKDLGNVIAVSGKIRSGKSTLVSGLANLYTLLIEENIMDNLETTELILHDVDFAALIEYINDEKITLDNFPQTIRVLLSKFIQKDDLNRIKYTNNLGEKYFDYINYKNKIQLLQNYVKNYLYLNRKSYVFSNIRMFSQIHATYAYEFNNEWIHLKNEPNFPLLPYSIFIEDDKLMFDSNLGYAKKMHEDTGSDLFYRLFGHLFQEMSYYICTVQDVNRWIKYEREIAQSHIYISSHATVVGNYPKLNMLLIIYKIILKIIYWVLKKLSTNEEYFDNTNWFKRRFYKIHQARKKLFSKAFVLYETGIYSDINKVGKEITEDDTTSKNFKFVLPVQYVYGNINTHEFNAVYDHLYDNSKVKYSDLKEMKVNDEEILHILDKKEDIKTDIKDKDLSKFY